MPTLPGNLHEFDGFRELLYEKGQEVEVYRPESYVGHETLIREKRRMRGIGFDIDDPRLAMTLTEADGVLRPGRRIWIPAPAGNAPVAFRVRRKVMSLRP